MTLKVLQLAVLILVVGTILLCCQAVPSPRALKPLEPSEDYTHSLVVDEDEPDLFRLYWKLVDNDEFLQFEVHCQTTGWVGFGLSPNGDMPGADIAIAWVDDQTGKAHLRVLFSLNLLLVFYSLFQKLTR